ncbi:hypothetical protein LCGC14_1706950 [marine sediment metagenome]|uniref:Uncharacterized protein n=1 Tax=marine sediment metagenome TaxID=412755 RepID=A0A0F9HGS8_9ZZZZ
MSDGGIACCPECGTPVKHTYHIIAMDWIQFISHSWECQICRMIFPDELVVPATQSPPLTSRDE